MSPSGESSTGIALAVTAESLYLVNLLLLPGLGFLALLILWWKRRNDAPVVARAHLDQTLRGSLWAGVLLVVANGLILLFGGYQGPQVWVVVITYFTVCHATLVVYGAYGLAKAMAGQCWRFPLIGHSLPAGCSPENG